MGENSSHSSLSWEEPPPSKKSSPQNASKRGPKRKLRNDADTDAGSEILATEESVASKKPSPIRRSNSEDEWMGLGDVVEFAKRVWGEDDDLGDEEFLKKGLQLMEKSKLAKLEKKWMKWRAAELEVFQKRVEIFRVLILMAIEAHKSSK